MTAFSPVETNPQGRGFPPHAEAGGQGTERDFFLYYMRNDLPAHRFAVSVNRRVGSSVQRNYLKRVMKELFRNHGGLLEVPHDLWVVLKQRFDRERRGEVERLFTDALVRIEYQE